MVSHLKGKFVRYKSVATRGQPLPEVATFGLSSPKLTGSSSDAMINDSGHSSKIGIYTGIMYAKRSPAIMVTCRPGFVIDDGKLPTIPAQGGPERLSPMVWAAQTKADGENVDGQRLPRNLLGILYIIRLSSVGNIYQGRATTAWYTYGIPSHALRLQIALQRDRNPYVHLTHWTWNDAYPRRSMPFDLRMQST